MFELLEMRTMLLVGALVSLTLAGVMVYYSIARRTYPGFHYWTAGIVSVGMGAVLVSMRGALPGFMTIIIGNCLIAAMPLLLTKGLTVFLDVEWKMTVINSSIFSIFLATFLWGTYLHQSLYVRVVCLLLTMTLFFSETLVIAIRYVPSVLDEQDWLLITSLVFSMAALVLRLVSTVFYADILSFMTHAGAWHRASVLMSILGEVGIACSFLILHTHRMENDLNNARMKIETLANMDGLTNLFNRRYFDAKLEQEFKRLQRSTHPVSLIMADIDCFKLYNDTYGHQAGDDCLKDVAAAFKKSGGRVSDIAARYGGEEFVMLLPNTDQQGARKVAETIRTAIEALAIAHATSSVSGFVTVSIGVATVSPDRSTSPDLLVKLADQALYRSKENGKNQIHMHV